MSSSELSEENFRRCCQLLLQLSQQLEDGWSWESVTGSEEGYLKKTELRAVVLDSSLVWEHEGLSSEEEPDALCDSSPHQQKQQQELSDVAAPDDCVTADMDADSGDDCVCTVAASSRKVLQYEYHVLYSCSYATPVLYFRVSALDGKSLSLEDLWSSVTPCFRRRLQRSPLNTITLQEHPLLAQPFFMLHPCKTQEFMSPVLQVAHDQNRPVNYVLTWLSVVGPVVGLELPLKYCTQLHQSSIIRSPEPD